MAKILVVDDAAFMRLRLKSIVEGKGHQVDEAEDGQSALEKIQRDEYDLIFLDITMPRMDGLTALKAILKETPDAKVVMCTAMGQQSIILEAIQAGAKDFIVKPFDPDRVVQALERLL